MPVRPASPSLSETWTAHNSWPGSFAHAMSSASLKRRVRRFIWLVLLSGREVGDVLRLVAPVDAVRGEVLGLDEHLRVRLHRVERDGLFVLADDGERDAALREREDGALEIDERFADGIVAAEPQVLPALIADDAAPERVVEIEDEELARVTANAAQGRAEIARGGVEDRTRKADLAHVPKARVVRLFRGHPSGRVEH